MPTVPFLEQSVQQQGYRPAELNTPKNYGRIVPDTGMQQLSQDLNEIAANQKKKADQVAMIEAQRRLDDWEAANLFDPQNGALSKKGKDTFGLPDKLAGDFDKFGQEVFDGLATEEQKVAFKQKWLERNDSIRRTLYAHERQQMDGYAVDNANAGFKSAVNRGGLYYNIPEIVDKSITEARLAARQAGMFAGQSEDVIAVKELEAESAVRMAALTRMAQADPGQAIDFYQKNAHLFTAGDLATAQNMMVPVERKYKAQDAAKKVLSTARPLTSPSDIIKFIMYDIEGGDKVVIDNDGGTVKYGINHKHNNMTPEQVAQLDDPSATAWYLNNYYKSDTLDNLPVDMRLVAADAFVNHGVDDHTKKMIADAGGDARKLIEIRRDYYKELVRKDPKNEKYYAGWMRRLAKLSGKIDAMRGSMPSAYELNSRIDAEVQDIEVANDAKQIVKSTLEAMQTDKKQRETAAAEEAWGYISSGRSVPPDVEARMNPKEVVDMRNNNGTTNMMVYAEARNKIITGQQIDLSPLRWQLGGKYDELVQLQQDPSKVVNARTVDDVLKSATQRYIGKTTPKTSDEIEKVENFRQIIQAEVDQLQKANNRPVSGDEVQRIVDRRLLTVDPEGFWSGETRLIDVEPGKKYSVSGIPDNRKHVIMTGDGKEEEIGYTQMVDDLIALANIKNLPVTPDNLAKLYKRAIEAGYIAQRYGEGQ